MSRVKHARKVLVDLIKTSAPVVEPDPENAEPASESVVEATPPPNAAVPDVEPPAEKSVESVPLMRAQTYTAFPIGTLTQVIDNVIESTEMQIAMLTEFKEALEEMRTSAFILAENQHPETVPNTDE